ncbi:hypothetical protein B1813_13130 [Saccharomonospora piscinae]|uniref:Uncharacterized protein n=1 Tax=Saccharomonospora piscinae TaxID=687388 RepID=A0A1V9A7C3_SACPI|nr:hypothetical protein [Saccharomonospora piscinae]OQO93037.1 hypothetical protein B1813_13130 [Saccharomonospora piscinae]
MTDTPAAVTVRQHTAVSFLLVLVPLVLGAALGLVVDPLVNWLIDRVDSAPAPLRLAAELPPAWAAAALAAVGTGAGVWLAHRARAEALTLTVGPDEVRLTQNGAQRCVSRAAVAEVFLDRRDLVLLDARARQLARHDARELNPEAVGAAFARFAYPWCGTEDPHESEFRRWADGDPALADELHGLLRSRADAVLSKDTTRATELADSARERGIVVRDRDGAQQYRWLVASCSEGHPDCA